MGRQLSEFFWSKQKNVYLACIWIEFHLIYSTYACENIAHTYIILYIMSYGFYMPPVYEKKITLTLSGAGLLQSPFIALIQDHFVQHLQHSTKKNTLLYSNKRILDSKTLSGCFFFNMDSLCLSLVLPILFVKLI